MKKSKANIMDKKNLEQGLVTPSIVACADSKILGAFKNIKETCYA